MTLNNFSLSGPKGAYYIAADTQQIKPFGYVFKQADFDRIMERLHTLSDDFSPFIFNPSSNDPVINTRQGELPRIYRITEHGKKSYIHLTNVHIVEDADGDDSYCFYGMHYSPTPDDFPNKTPTGVVAGSISHDPKLWELIMFLELAHESHKNGDTTIPLLGYGVIQ